MWIRLGAVLALPLVLTGCGDKHGADGGTTGRTAADLDGTSWIGTRVTEDSRPRALVAGSQLRVEFADGSVSIHAGCNRMAGRYSVSDRGELTVGPIAGTDMGCDQALMDQDSWLSGTVFAEPLTANVDGSTLTLARPGLELVLADRKVASPDASLQGTSWQLDGIRSGDAVSSVPAGARVPTLSVAADGTVTLHTGCNSGRSTAVVSGSTITFSAPSTTKMACVEESGRQTEAAVLAVLDGEVQWSISEQALTLTKGDHGLVYRVAR